MKALINYLLKKPDNIEKIRDQIALILKIECANQYAEALKESENADDYNIGVYIHAERPWQLTENNQGENPFPLVNIQFLEYKKDNEAGTETVNKKRYVATFAVDCYTRGQPDNPEYGDDTDSALRAMRLGSVIRNILMSSFYNYLGIRSIVRRREIMQIEIGSPSGMAGNIDESAISVTICRLLFSVWFYEESPQAQPVDLEDISFKAISPAGEVLIDI
jgi:hypothetical protein